MATPGRAGRSLAPNLRLDRAARPRKTPVVLSLLLAAVVAAALIPQAALAASGGIMGGRSSSSSSSWGYSDSSSSDSDSDSESYSYYSSTTYVSAGTRPPVKAMDVGDGDGPGTVFWVVAVGLVLLFAAVMYCRRPRTTVVKLQVALLAGQNRFSRN